VIWGSNPGGENGFFSLPKRPDWLCGSPNLLLVPGYFPSMAKLPWHETDHLPPSKAAVKNEWSYTPKSPYIT